ncbi:DoxX family membrane protein [Arthrobacter ginkgonis]|uniref:DoxX family membrane protein n=1 Tax=Arthrobacter ginkgonis TaxID=1630594 RepID=A0ABP7C8B8_9MICC
MTVVETRPGLRAAAAPAPEPLAASARRALAVLRILLGSVFLWAFVDKAFGFGFATPPERAWIAGGSPTTGYLGNLEGTLAPVFGALAGQAWVDVSFMLGMLAVGAALVLGIALRAAAVGGTLIMGLMWLSALPLANNPLVDEHLIYAAALWVLAAARAGRTWGLARTWESLAHRRLRLLG